MSKEGGPSNFELIRFIGLHDTEVAIACRRNLLHITLRHIYHARQQVPCSVDIDGGSGYCKYGWSNFNKPMVYDQLAAKPALKPLVLSTPICHYEDTEVAPMKQVGLYGCCRSYSKKLQDLNSKL
ncbi:hypothetical protein KP509_14G025500 [Ceratopteris richardii]|uniref:Uncharacterized protein n=1 Tax=Ceratopteris richardii TaxID=49495 RepID=A0A8T2TD53_CERRI|nr:hypothetical protein KP509_14G025500 [Ceratopteris richardii]